MKIQLREVKMSDGSDSAWDVVLCQGESEIVLGIPGSQTDAEDVQGQLTEIIEELTIEDVSADSDTIADALNKQGR